MEPLQNCDRDHTRAGTVRSALLFFVLLGAVACSPGAKDGKPPAVESHARALSTTLVPKGSTWRYLATATAAPATWKDRTGFDDATWASGPAKLGYGDPDVVTAVGFGPDPLKKWPTTYFRKSIDVANPAAYSTLTFNLMRDDGAVVYLNGTEVFRSNMRAGAVDYSTFAQLTTSDADEKKYFSFAAPANLVAGSNVIAVEVHQVDVDSSDMGFDLELVGSDDIKLLRGPYLQLPTPTSVTVRFRTDAPATGRVRYGTAMGALSGMAMGAAATRDHVITVTGLVPDTKYFYAIDAGPTVMAGGDAATYFSTPPPAGIAQPTRVWILGDGGTANAALNNVKNIYAMDAGSKDTDLWLLLGDNAYTSGTDDQYQKALFDVHGPLLRRTFVWPAIGNHDTNQSVAAPDTIPYFNIFSLPKSAEAGGVASGSERYYSFDYSNIHFVCLDSMTAAGRAAGSAMLTWLRSDLMANHRDWLVVFFHHPPYSKGTHDSDKEVELIEMRENVLPILEENGVDLVLSGHSHAYERSVLLDGHYGSSTMLAAGMRKNSGSGQPANGGAYQKAGAGPNPHQGAVYVVSGSASELGGTALNHPAMYASIKRNGSVVLDVDGNRLDAKFLMDTNTTPGDTFRIVKGQAPTPVNMPPTVTIASPAASYQTPATVMLTSMASDPDGMVTKVEFFQGPNLLGTSTTAPYQHTWSNVTTGTYSVTARATDDKGATTTSAPLVITVTSANMAPTVSLALDKAAYEAPATIVMTATVADVDGTVARVDYFQGSTLLFSTTTPPHKYSWTPVYAGSYMLSARAVDDDGAAATTPVIPVTVTLAVPAAPAGLVAVLDGNAVALTWQTLGVGITYKIEQSVNGGAAWTSAGTSAIPSLSLPGLVPDTAYQFRVRGTNAAGDSPPSNVVMVMTPKTCQPMPEVCNNIDDDCNGMIDDVAVAACGVTMGECRAGMTACVADPAVGKKLVCQNEKVASPELCDGKDNDCDGMTDEDFNVGAPCGPQAVGECRRGTLMCAANAVSCVGSQGPVAEICGDSKDNDCDGMTDEDCSLPDAAVDMPPPITFEDAGSDSAVDVRLGGMPDVSIVRLDGPAGDRGSDQRDAVNTLDTQNVRDQGVDLQTVDAMTPGLVADGSLDRAMVSTNNPIPKPSVDAQLDMGAKTALDGAADTGGFSVGSKGCGCDLGAASKRPGAGQAVGWILFGLGLSLGWRRRNRAKSRMP